MAISDLLHNHGLDPFPAGPHPPHGSAYGHCRRRCLHRQRDERQQQQQQQEQQRQDDLQRGLAQFSLQPQPDLQQRGQQSGGAGQPAGGGRRLPRCLRDGHLQPGAVAGHYGAGGVAASGLWHAGILLQVSELRQPQPGPVVEARRLREGDSRWRRRSWPRRRPEPAPERPLAIDIISLIIVVYSGDNGQGRLLPCGRAAVHPAHLSVQQQRAVGDALLVRPPPPPQRRWRRWQRHHMLGDIQHLQPLS